MKPHRARILAMQAIFQKEFHNRPLQELESFDWIDYNLPQDDRDFALLLIHTTLEHQKEIDELIKNYSEHWDFDRISPVNKAILRISLAQLLYLRHIVPPKVSLDEAIRLAKEYAEDDSSRFINGILDRVYKSHLTSSTPEKGK
ncbi:MAG: transcription antitermination factor NusB [Leptospiraceae bacterium]|nr:transcription antitermination factor NusB [Leptospiraceae bacterium]MDW8306862.1 transcription antitermination factor NusB [Leptospiraceae bacterium]